MSYDARLEEEPEFNDYKATMQAFRSGGPLPRLRAHRYISSDEETGDENEDEQLE